jgi:hypothetical protein
MAGVELPGYLGRVIDGGGAATKTADVKTKD